MTTAEARSIIMVEVDGLQEMFGAHTDDEIVEAANLLASNGGCSMMAGRYGRAVAAIVETYGRDE